MQYYNLTISLLELETGWTLETAWRESEREVVFNRGKYLGTLLLKSVFDAVLQKSPQSLNFSSNGNSNHVLIVICAEKGFKYAEVHSRAQTQHKACAGL